MNETKIRKRLRGADMLGPQAVVQAISEFRFNQPIAEFPACIRAIRSAAPKQALQLLALGPRHFRDLVWTRQSLMAMSLERELEWAYCWLRGQSSKLNGFRRFTTQVQSQVIAGELIIANLSIDEFIRTHGWSLWAVELRCALEQLACGTDGQKKWTGKLQETAHNSIPGLLLQVFSDRNDATFSYDAFYSKCVDSFPRFGSIEEWVPWYLFYRALSHVGKATDTLPAVLARDISSSLIDYYETVVDTLSHVAVDASLRDLRPLVCKIARGLVIDGYKDHRIVKLAITLDKEHIDHALNEEGNTSDALEALHLAFYGSENNAKDIISSPPFNLTLEQILECQNEGMCADSTIADILKFGVNLKGLDVGLAVAHCAQQATSNLVTEPVVPFGISLLSPRIKLEDVAALEEEDTASNLLAHIGKKHDDQAVRETASLLHDVLGGQDAKGVASKIPPILRIWLAHQLLRQRRFKELHHLLENDHADKQWIRHADKIRQLAHLGERQLFSAIDCAVTWLLKDPRYAFEFPLTSLFENREWSAFRDIDPVLLGVASHHAYAAFGDPKVGYICKMACRKFVLSGARESLPDSYYELSNPNQELLVVFLRDVWVEENLSMNHFLESTDDVRRDRMQVLQMLLQWDIENESGYVDAIKELTFDETLRKGLMRIDQTRVFVNESVITRWAEKELYQDYERWRQLTLSSTDSKLIDDILRQYAVDPSNISLLNEISNGKPTEADGVLIDLVNRLFKRFLLDPNDGLDCYLSVRIRHGSLRGTLFGALEEQGLLYSAKGFSQKAFEDRWGPHLNLHTADRIEVLTLLEEFTLKLRALVDELVNERVQIHSLEKPAGAIKPYLSPMFGRLLASSLAERPESFPAFICTCYFLFWKVIELGLNEISAFIRTDMSARLQDEFNTLVGTLRNYGPRTLPLITALTTVATTTHSQCETIAGWFHPPGQDTDEKYTLHEAIEIARAATKNVYRAFPAELDIGSIPKDELPLSTSGLAVLSDCLFVIFENSWKHSGFAENIGVLNVEVSFDTTTKLLTLTVLSDLSPLVRGTLQQGELEKLRGRYLDDLSPDLARREGGSGFAKLARLVRTVDRKLCARPMDFGLQEERWYTQVTIPLYEREGAYEAYE